MEAGTVASPKGIYSMVAGSNEVDGCIDEIRSLLLLATHKHSNHAENSRFQVIFRDKCAHLCALRFFLLRKDKLQEYERSDIIRLLTSGKRNTILLQHVQVMVRLL